ncbi:MAG: YdcF family protein [Rickettsiales bacterium]|jgi:uncharacterized SAM-binding protein YcdF (DUF218 family)|nr:YdcF family protein [Rickettsiales bacterium]
MFKLSAPSHCVGLRPDDSIFVLTGDMRRIPAGVKLLNDAPDRKMYIIGVGGARPENFASQNIWVESESKTTYENAAAIARIVAANDLQRIVLVTTEEHISRALLLTRRALPPETQIVPCPVPLRHMPAPARLTRWTMEYIKFIATVLGVYEKG